MLQIYALVASLNLGEMIYTVLQICTVIIVLTSGRGLRELLYALLYICAVICAKICGQGLKRAVLCCAAHLCCHMCSDLQL